MEKLEKIIFYTLEKTIKSYRQFAQRQIKKAGYTITIDQWLILRTLQEHPSLGQNELSRIIFKDNASVTRIVELLVRAKLVERHMDDEDKRRRQLSLTEKGVKILEEVQVIVRENREYALQGISREQLEDLKENLEQITNNCSLN